MRKLFIATVGPVQDDVVAAVEQFLGQTFGLPTGRMAEFPDPSYAFDPQRGQHSSTLILRNLLDRVPGDCIRLLALTECDLFIPMLSFIFGQAQVPGKVAIVSLARLRQEFYGLPPSRQLLFSRVLKEAAHETGHTFGLVHCREETCAMSLSAGIHQVDAKGGTYCDSCRLLLGEKLAAANRETAA
jgi:archaemetzincin